jgi:hypothetical protein
MDPGSAASWQAADVNSGLPLRDRTRFAAIVTVAVGTGGTPVLAGGASGVHRSLDAQSWVAAANRETQEVVTVPDTWLLCSGDHDIEVVRDDASNGH